MGDFEKAPEGVDDFVLKICSGCRIGKPATTEYFYSDRSRKDGLQSFCKPCGLAHSSSYHKKVAAMVGSELWILNRAAKSLRERRYAMRKKGMPFLPELTTEFF